MASHRRFITTSALNDAGCWDWDLYREVERFFDSQRIGRRTHTEVRLVDSDGHMDGTSVEHVADRARSSGVRPSEMTAEYRLGRRTTATLTVATKDSQTTASVRFESNDEVLARGLQAALHERLQRVEAIRQSGEFSIESSERRRWSLSLSLLFRVFTRNPWLIGVSTSLIGGALLLLILR
jgi:hypothetical protein